MPGQCAQQSASPGVNLYVDGSFRTREGVTDNYETVSEPFLSQGQLTFNKMHALQIWFATQRSRQSCVSEQ